MIKPKQIGKFLAGGWLLSILGLFLYSFTQIDLGLTLTRISIWQILQKQFQSVGYFNRPLSATLYLLILLFLFVFYLLILKGVQKKWLSAQQIWSIILITSIILLFSYNAFSHDLFNYIFDAKILVGYRQSPYQAKPLDFPNDPMLGFLHWTHRPSVYPPLWIGLSVIPFVLSFGKLIPQMIAFKMMMVAAYLGTIWLIWKISAVFSPKRKLFNVAFYAFNPLVIVESSVSAHNDVVMIFFAFLGFSLLVKKRDWLAFLPWLFSIGIKIATITLVPLFVLTFWSKIRVKKVDDQKLSISAIILMFLTIFYVSYRLGFQPWYLLWAFPFVALRLENKLFAWGIIGLSIGALLRYLPFLYYGHWDPPIPIINFWLISGGLLLGLLIFSLEKIKLLPKNLLTFD